MSQQVKSKLSIAATAAFDEISQILDKTNVSDARYNKNSFAWKKLIADLVSYSQSILCCCNDQIS